MCQNNCNCISDILNVIYLLQKNCSQCENAIDSCDKPILGQFACSNYNTRILHKQINIIYQNIIFWYNILSRICLCQCMEEII